MTMPSNLNRRGFLKAAALSAPLLRAPSLLRAADARKRPNLLFLMTDQQRWDAMSAAGNRILQTPNLDRLAREGARFATAYAACPVCAPARTSILTGLSIHATGVTNNECAKPKGLKGDEGVFRAKTFDEILVGAGYAGEYYGKWHTPVARAGAYRNGVELAGDEGGRKTMYRDYLKEKVGAIKQEPGELLAFGYPYRPDPIDSNYGAAETQKTRQNDQFGWLKIPAEHSPTAFIGGQVIEAIGRLSCGPFTLTASFNCPHPPMVVPKPYYGMYPPETLPLPQSLSDNGENSPYSQPNTRRKATPPFANPKLIPYMISDYYGLVREVDDWIGRILDALDAHGLAQNTLVVFTADHGEMLGAHGRQGKGVFYEEAAHVPLLMRLPGVIQPGMVIAEPVTQRDIFPTILDLCGAGAPPCHGRSLRGLLEGQAEAKKQFEFAVSEWDKDGANYMVRSGGWKLMIHRDPESEYVDGLYNLDTDPGEMRNLIGANPDRERHLAQAEELKAMLVAWLERVGSPYLEGVRRRTLR